MPRGVTLRSTMVGCEVNERRGTSLWFRWEGIRKAGQAGLGLAALNSFCGLRGKGAVPCCLVPGPGVGRAGV